MRAYIYVIKHPYTKKVVYVGQTRNFKSRKTMHLTSKKTKSPIGCFILKLRESGLLPIIEIVLECDESRRWDKESEIMNKYKKAGVQLLNCHGNPMLSRKIDLTLL